MATPSWPAALGSVLVSLGAFHLVMLVILYPSVLVIRAAGDGVLSLVIRSLVSLFVIVLSVTASAFALARIPRSPLAKMVVASGLAASYLVAIFAIHDAGIQAPIVFPRAGAWRFEVGFVEMAAAAVLNPAVVLIVVFVLIAVASFRAHRRATIRRKLAGPCAACGAVDLRDAEDGFACAACGARVAAPDASDVEALASLHETPKD